MRFCDRLALVREYRIWVEEQNKKYNFDLYDNHETFLAFLEAKGLLNEKPQEK